LLRQFLSFSEIPATLSFTFNIKLGWVNLSGFQNLSKKLDDLLSQDPATKISLYSNLNRALLRSKMAVIDAVFPLNSSPTSEPSSLKLEPIILLASSWDNKSSIFCSGFEIRSTLAHPTFCWCTIWRI
jgi:hypothetical protein